MQPFSSLPRFQVHLIFFIQVYQLQIKKDSYPSSFCLFKTSHLSVWTIIFTFILSFFPPHPSLFPINCFRLSVLQFNFVHLKLNNQSTYNARHHCRDFNCDDREKEWNEEGNGREGEWKKERAVISSYFALLHSRDLAPSSLSIITQSLAASLLSSLHSIPSFFSFGCLNWLIFASLHLQPDTISHSSSRISSNAATHKEVAERWRGRIAEGFIRDTRGRVG